MMEIQYRIDNMIEDYYKFNYDFDYNSVNKEDLGFQVEHSIKVLKETEQIVLVLRVYIFNTNEEELVCQSVRATFKVQPLEHFIKMEEDEGMIVSNPLLIDTFINILVGAARGMLVKNLKNTPIEEVVLPLIPMNVIRQNAIKQ